MQGTSTGRQLVVELELVVVLVGCGWHDPPEQLSDAHSADEAQGVESALG